MFQRLIRTLKQKELFAPTAFILAFIIVLSLIILLGQFFHQSLQEEMAEQFNKQQLLLAREVSANINDFLLHVYKDINVISRLPEIDKINKSPRCRSVAEAINFNIQNEVLVTIRVLNKNGIVLYDSAYPGREESTCRKPITLKGFPAPQKRKTDHRPALIPGCVQDSKQFLWRRLSISAEKVQPLRNSTVLSLQSFRWMA
jgi:hypothetical protein